MSIYLLHPDRALSFILYLQMIERGNTDISHFSCTQIIKRSLPKNGQESAGKKSWINDYLIDSSLR
jgi:hypothetical protein